MRYCIALAHSRVCESMWLPCARVARTGDHFCDAHRDALDGAFMGLLNIVEYPEVKHEEERKSAHVQKRKHRKRDSSNPVPRDNSPRANTIDAAILAAFATGRAGPPGAPIPGSNFRTCSETAKISAAEIKTSSRSRNHSANDRSSTVSSPIDRNSTRNSVRASVRSAAGAIPRRRHAANGRTGAVIVHPTSPGGGA